jgi:hypothetical protein
MKAGSFPLELARIAFAKARLDPESALTLVLDVLRETGAEDQARTLIDRLPVEGNFDLFRKQAGYRMAYRFGREPDGSPAPSWSWDDLD